jgi:hypothetical protein
MVMMKVVLGFTYGLAKCAELIGRILFLPEYRRGDSASLADYAASFAFMHD